MEEWKAVPNYIGHYMVSNLGRVKSVKFNKEKLLTPSFDASGYKKVSLSLSNKSKTYTIHQLVAISFLKHKPDSFNGLVVDHIDNDKTNNSIDNLQLISQRENIIKQNRGNNKHTGVTWHKHNKLWRARITINKKQITLGYFNCETKAHLEYNKKLLSLK